MTVIKKTRLKFFVVMAAIVVFIVAAFCASILISTHSRNNFNIDLVLQNMINGFDRPVPLSTPKPPDNRLNEFRGFSLRLNDDFEIVQVKHNEMVFTEAEIAQYIIKIKSLNKASGQIDDIRFLLVTTESGTILACLDVGMENAMFNSLLTTVFLAGGGGILILWALLWLLSFWIIKPAADALKNQKRFISEAGHELKTPLTIISAGVELLQKSQNEADNPRWLNNIAEQIDKMSAMTSQLLALSKIDEGARVAKSQFDLSQTILTEALAFESLAFESGKTLQIKIDEGIIYNGNHQAVCQMTAILCDNAVKYSLENSVIELRLKKQSSKIRLYVLNKSDLIVENEIPHIFERFYRGSESRGATSGTGLGLAILKTLAEQNDWKLNVDVKQNLITFSVIL